MTEPDLALPLPGDLEQEADVVPPGDIPAVAGEESLRRWVLRLVATEPGELLHRPDFGVGVDAYLDQPIGAAAMQLSNEIRRQVRRDRRVRDVDVRTSTSRRHPHRLDVDLQITTTDGALVGASTVIDLT